VVEMLPCLAASKDPADAKALETLRARGPTVIRNALKTLPTADSKAPGQ
jgi:hypothetical protein